MATGLGRPMPGADAVPFYMHTDPALDHGWLRDCPEFAPLAQSAYNERLAEVYVRDALAVHPWRTADPGSAVLIYVPLWEVVSFNVGDCNGTTHHERMARAATALRKSELFVRHDGHGPVHADPRVARHAGFNHLIVSSGCIEKGARLEARLSRRLAGILRAAIVGRDRAYSSFYAASAVGRCTIEVPYVSNPHARAAYMNRRRLEATAVPSAIVSAAALAPAAASARSVGVGGGGSGGGRRKWLLSFMGSLDVCCPPGKEIRRAMHKLVTLPSNESVQVLHFARAAGRPLPGRTPEEQTARYSAAGEQMASSRFCLIPAGDNEVSSRLYSAMSAGCLPVVVANQLSGAFSSRVAYSSFWVRVEQSTFIANPRALLARLRAMPQSEVAERRSRMLRFVPDVTYEQTPRGHASDRAAAAAPPSGKPLPSIMRSGRERLVSSRLVSSRLVSNLLRAAETGCLMGTPTPTTGVYPPWHKYAGDDRWGLNCSCTQKAPTFFWGPKQSGSHANRAKLWTRGRVPTEVCRCLHCATLCPEDEANVGAGASDAAGGSTKGVAVKHGGAAALGPGAAHKEKHGRLAKPRDMLAERDRAIER